MVKNDIKYPGSTNQWLLPMGQLSIIGFEATIATIDGGPLALLTHATGALFFFVTLLITVTLSTITIRDMWQWCPDIMSR